MKFPFLLSSLHLDFGRPFVKPFLCVRQCHRSEGGEEDLFTTLIPKLSCNRGRGVNVTLHCTENL